MAQDTPFRLGAALRPADPAGGRVLDLAAGAGRHTRLLLDMGFGVTAVDRDIAAIAAACRRPSAKSARSTSKPAPPWTLGDGYDGIVVTNYLHRPLFARSPRRWRPAAC